MSPRKLSRAFYTQTTQDVAQALLGKLLVHRDHEGTTVGRIVETEAYGGLEGPDDNASHAHRGLTGRNRVMFGMAGMSYVYFIYGMYHCFNIVTEKEGIGAAVLIRALEPVEGMALMQKRRGKERLVDLANGPGKLCIAMNLDRRHNGIDLTGSRVFVLNETQKINTIHKGPRVGIRHAREKLWRFFVAGSPYVSKSAR